MEGCRATHLLHRGGVPHPYTCATTVWTEAGRSSTHGPYGPVAPQEEEARTLQRDRLVHHPRCPHRQVGREAASAGRGR
ncbi:hypothetical protein U9M48_006559 [Paspalum notatum var. saurae]|uniref:Uncharacterized protein n=1 Tax=Paspalum notatum var. saurae TaxID=547442 RepID=A0AAQ3SLV4_PASNO